MALTSTDRDLLERCLQRDPAAWQRFINRFSGLFVHSIQHTAECRSYTLSEADIDEICGEILKTVVENEMQVLRQFRGKSSLATYLAVIARRVSVQEIVKRHKMARETLQQTQSPAMNGHPEQDLMNKDQVEFLVRSLSDYEAQIVKAYHLDGKSYQEISSLYDIPENSIGPVLTRAREYMRRMN